MIPKIIWQTHEWEWDNLPEKFKKQSTTWKEHNPGWNYRYCSSKKRLEHMESFGKKYLESYLKIDDKIMQSDFWRYSVIYNFGGIYIDMDTMCTEDNFLNNRVSLDKELVTSGNYDNINSSNNAFFAAEKKSEFLKNFIDLVNKFALHMEQEVLNLVKKQVEPLKPPLRNRVSNQTTQSSCPS